MHRRNCLQLGLAGLAGGSFVDLLAMRLRIGWQCAVTGQTPNELHFDLDGWRPNPLGDV